MGDADEKIHFQPSISSREHEELLNIIDNIRSQGVSRYVDIPQIVVCGDQSSGKSSTLEAICGLRFPTSDGLCTRFATEYILRRTADRSINISIVPDTADPDRSDAERAKLQVFKPSCNDLEDFTVISKEAADAMGIDKSGKIFSHDVLRVEICGPTQPHLTLVDLPGLFHAGLDRKGDDNVEAVNALVKSYIEKPRSIILAVVSAKNDLNLQKVIKFIRDYDPHGNRTLGVITKPDTLPENSPSEAQYLKVAQNLEVPYALGWHVVKNRSFEEQNYTTTERDSAEEQRLNKGIWNGLNRGQKGVAALRTRLSKVLQNHIISELPNLMKDVDGAITECNKRLETLGPSRGTLEQQRRYLLRASEKFTRLMAAAIEGSFTHSFFGSSETDSGFEKRLRAKVTAIWENFANTMRTRGHAVILVDKVPLDYKNVAKMPQKIKKEDFHKQIQNRMKRNRGRELPGLFSPDIVADLFFDHSRPWDAIVGATRDDLLEAAHATVRRILEESVDENILDAIQHIIINPNMEPIELALFKKAVEILKPYRQRHPQTMNHYFIENIQKMREDESRKEINDRIYQFFGVDPDHPDPAQRRYDGNFDARSLADTLVQRTEVDMGRFAAIEAVNATMAYYKASGHGLHIHHNDTNIPAGRTQEHH
jgi:GTPase SAR1 family protein